MTTAPAVDTATLDALLAERLLGCKTRGGACPAAGHRDLSTTGDGMLLVLEAMRERGWSSEIYDEGARQWGFIHLGEDKAGWSPDSCEAWPLAVALAAEAALEADA
jgi:hypothetical protein